MQLRLVLLIGLLALSACTPRSQDPAVTASDQPAKILVSFGRCGGDICPGPENKVLAGDQQFQTIMQDCLAEEFGRPVDLLGTQSSSSGYWVDLQITTVEVGDGRRYQAVIMLAHRDGAFQLADSGTATTPISDATYRRMCHDFASDVKSGANGTYRVRP
jgi:hypothetical protein